MAGVGLAKLLSGVFASAGIDLPSTGTVFGTRTIVVSLAVGIVVTVLASLGPALRATRVSPVTAMREGTDIPAGRIGRRAPLFAAITGALALAVLGLGMFGPGIDAEGRLALLAPGSLLLFIAVALISPRLVPRLASVLGRPGQRIAGAAGGLARRNAMRNPGRTAATAAALMIGIALVAFSAVLGAGMRESTKGALDEQVRADYVIVGQDGWSPIDPAAAKAAADVAGRRGRHRPRAGPRPRVRRADHGRRRRRGRGSPPSSASSGRTARTTRTRSSAPAARSSRTGSPRTTTSRWATASRSPRSRATGST